MSRLPSVVESLRAEVLAELQAWLGAEGPAAGLYVMLRYHFGWLDAQLRPASGPSGKLLRPTLCLLAAQAVGGDYRRALPAAAAVELLHNFSLIHDDIQDQSDERHHRPTVWKLWGEAQAIDAGDAALALAELAILSAAERGADPAVVVAGARALNRACLRLAEGQHLDMSFEGKLDVTAEQYFEMISGKTAALLGCSLELGALFGSADLALAERYGEAGRELGLAFQIQDDLLGIWGSEARTGKPSAADIVQRKMTLPVIYALERASPDDRATLAVLYGSASLDSAQVALALDILNRSGAKGLAEALAGQHYARALEGLRLLGPAPAPAAALEALASFLISRDY